MNTIRHHSLATLLALTVLGTVGPAAHAQNGKSLRGLIQNRSNHVGSNNGGGPKFSLQNNNSFQSINRMQASKKNLGGILSGNLQNQQTQTAGQGNSLLGINRNNLKLQNGNRVLNSGKLQQIVGGGGLQSITGKGKTLDNSANKLNGLQNLIHGGKGPNGLVGNKGKGNGNVGSTLLNLIQHNQKQGKVCVDHDHWCHTMPKSCHWWYDWCKPLAYCDTHHHVHCHWNYVTCDYIVGGRVIVADARWYLGMKGLFLPGQGIGVEEVTPGSPAAAVGLLPGMVITRVNGIVLVDETVLDQVIAQSGGVLGMELLLSANGPPATCVVVMQRVVSLNY